MTIRCGREVSTESRSRTLLVTPRTRRTPELRQHGGKVIAASPGERERIRAVSRTGRGSCLVARGAEPQAGQCFGDLAA